MNRVCVLLTGGILYDNRVIKTINLLNKYCKVDLYYTSPTPDDKGLFNENTRLFAYKKRTGLKHQVIKHSLFINEYLYLSKIVLRQKTKYDYVWANDLPVLKPALKIKQKTGAKVVYDSHEIYNETINQFFPKEAKGIKKLLFSLMLGIMRYSGTQAESRMVKKIDSFVTVCYSVKNYFANKYGQSNIHVVYNCPPLADGSDKIDFRKMLKLSNDTFVLLYQGVMNQGRALDEMVEAQKFTDDNIRFVLMGEGNIKKHLQNKAEYLGLQNKVIFIDRVHPSVLLKYTQGADAGIILQETNKNLSKKLGIANKFFEYIHSGIPFVATSAPENHIVADKYPVCVFVSEVHDVKEIAEAINSLRERPVPQFKEHAEAAAKEYNWQNQAKVIRKIVS